MAASHIEFASDVAGIRCPDCARDTAREAVLVNSFGLVLARGTSCVQCGHARHRAAHRTRRPARQMVAGVRVPRTA
jgi:Zn ribbon nucleic-acid-binding protein